MQRYLLIIMVLIMPYTAAAQEQISNLVIPVSYFVNHIKQLSLVKDNLTKYKKASIIGTSGIGKTQSSRMYAYENKNDYQIIWFFDCNLDLNEEFVKLAKAINKKAKTKLILEDVSTAKKEVLSYLSSKDKWLLVFDNLKVKENNKVQELIDLESNGHIIFGSQDGELLPNRVQMTAFEKSDTITLANSILENSDLKSAEFLSQEFMGYPILVVQGAQLLNQVPGLHKEGYKKQIHQSTDKIKLNISLAINELKPSSRELLNKIALINNQAFSKDLLQVITGHQDDLDDDIYQLSKFALIANIDTDENNPVFEMHDVIAQKVAEINEEKVNKDCLEDIVTRLIKSIPNSVVKAHIFREAKTIRENLEIIVQNVQKYNINACKLMELNLQLMVQYVNSLDLYNAEKLIGWFNKNDKEGRFKLWLMNNDERSKYAGFLGLIGRYYRKCSNYRAAIDYYTRVKDILEDVKGKAFKCNLFFGLAISRTALGQIHEAEQNIQIMYKMFQDNLLDKLDIGFMYFAQSTLLLTQGQYTKSLDYINKTIEVLMQNSLSQDDFLFTAIYILKAEILNSLGEYQEAYTQTVQLYNMHKPSKKEDHSVFGQIFTQMSIAKLGLGYAKEALEYASKARDIFINDPNRGNADLTVSTDVYLAKALVASGNALAALGQNDKSMKSYTVAENLYWNNYQNNMNNVDEISRMYLDAAKSACSLPEKGWYAKFHDEHITRFGSQHPRSIELLNMDIKCYH